MPTRHGPAVHGWVRLAKARIPWRGAGVVGLGGARQGRSRNTHRRVAHSWLIGLDEVDSEAMDGKRRHEDWRALRTVCRALFGENYLIGTDFEDIEAAKVDRKFEQGTGGVRITFTVSGHALGKMPGEVVESMEALLHDGG